MDEAIRVLVVFLRLRPVLCAVINLRASQLRIALPNVLFTTPMIVPTFLITILYKKFVIRIESLFQTHYSFFP